MNKLIGIIWPPAIHLSKEIVSAISTNENIFIVSEMDMALEDSFETFIFDLYDEGDYEQYGYLIDNKIRLITSRTNVRTVHVLYMEAFDTDIKWLKRQIRSEFKDRVASYEYDIIIHITDSEPEYIRTNCAIQKYKDYLNIK